jgi:hypothetical protein
VGTDNGRGEPPVPSGPGEGASDRVKPKSLARGFLAFLTSSWAVILAAIGGATAAVTLLFQLFPGLVPDPPPPERRVEISRASVAERQRITETGIVVDVVYFEVEAIGHEDNEIAVATLWIDAETGQRLEPDWQMHGRVSPATTLTEHVAIWFPVTYPFSLPRGSSGCVFLRIAVYEWVSEGTPPARVGDPDSLLLAVADTEPIALFDPTACGESAPTASVQTGWTSS